MATLTTRAGKGAPLTNNEVDGNFTNLNTELGTTVKKADFNAGTMLVAETDDTPVAKTSSQVKSFLSLNSITPQFAGMGTTLYLILRDASGANLGQTLTTPLVNRAEFNGNGTFLYAGSSGQPSAATAADVRNILNVENGSDVTDATNVDAAGAVMEADYNAGTLLYATSDNTPQPKTLDEFADLLMPGNHHLNGNKIYIKGLHSDSNPDTHHFLGYDAGVDGPYLKGYGGVRVENHLYINGSTSRTLNFGYFNSSGQTGTVSNYQADYGAYISNRIAAAEFNAHSDERIKNIIGVSNSEKDAEILQKIEVTDYTYKETGQKSKKVIGQQLEKVYPQAVSKIRKYIPDILREAESVASVQQGKHYSTTIKLADHGLQTDEFVEIESSADNSKIQTKVIKSTDNTFTVHTEMALPDAFVVGRRVDDFYVVDYEAVAMLSVSALQHEIKKRKRMERQLMELEQRLIKLEGSNNDDRATKNKIS